MGETKSLDTYSKPAKVWFLVDNENSTRLAFAYNTVTWGGRFNFIIDLSSNPDWESLYDSEPDLIINLTSAIPSNFPKNLTNKVRQEANFFTNGMSGRVPLLCSTEPVARYIEKSMEGTNLIIPSDFEITRNYHQIFQFGLFPSNWPGNLRTALDRIAIAPNPHPDANSAFLENLDLFTPLKLTVWDLEGSLHHRRREVRRICIVIGDTRAYQDATWAWNIRAAGHIVFFLDQAEASSTINDLSKWWENLKVQLGEQAIGYRGTLFTSKSGDISAFKSRLEAIFGEHLHAVTYSNLLRFSEFFSSIQLKTQTEHRIGYINGTRFEFEPSLPEFADFLDHDQRIGICYELPSLFRETAILSHVPAVENREKYYFNPVSTDNFYSANSDKIVSFTHYFKRTISCWLTTAADFWKRFFYERKLNLEVSVPGRNLTSIVNALGGIDSGLRILKYNSTRAVIRDLQNDKHAPLNTLQETVNRNWKESEVGFGLHHSTANTLLNDLCARKILRQGFELACEQCNNSSWYSIENVGNQWTCRFCYTEQATPLLKQNSLSLKVDGMFQLKDWAQGAITSALVLWRFHAFHSASIQYMPSFVLKNHDDKQVALECDLLINFHADLGSSDSIIAVESKSENNFQQSDVDKLLKLGRTISSETILCFATTRYAFDKTEIEIFKNLYQKDPHVMLLTSNELNPYDVNGQMFPDFVRDFRQNYFHDVQSLAMATIQRYLAMPADKVKDIRPDRT